MKSFTVMVEAEDMITVQAENEEDALQQAIRIFEQWSCHDSVTSYVMHSENIEEEGEDE